LLARDRQEARKGVGSAPALTSPGSPGVLSEVMKVIVGDTKLAVNELPLNDEHAAPRYHSEFFERSERDYKMLSRNSGLPK
jgi:hypothetical protein